MARKKSSSDSEALEKRNLKRKTRYSKDPRYCKQARMWSRDSYRRHNGVILRDCSANVEVLNTFGSVRIVIHPSGKRIGKRLCFSSTEMAALLGGYSVQNFYQWIAKDLVPRAIFKSPQDRIPLLVYMAEEAKGIAAVMADHQRAKAYLTRKDTATVRSLHNIVNAVRNRIYKADTTQQTNEITKDKKPGSSNNQGDETQQKGTSAETKL